MFQSSRVDSGADEEGGVREDVVGGEVRDEAHRREAKGCCRDLMLRPPILVDLPFIMGTCVEAGRDGWTSVTDVHLFEGIGRRPTTIAGGQAHVRLVASMLGDGR